MNKNTNNKVEYNEPTESAIDIANYQSEELMSDFVYSLRKDNIIKIDDESIQPYLDTTTKEFEELINELTYKLKKIEKDDLFNQMLFAIHNLMKNKNMTYEEAMGSLDIPKEKQRRYIQGLKRKFNVDIGEEEELSKHIYKMNPPCPNCNEEHMWWRRRIPLSAEKKLEEWYAQNPNASIFSPAPVFVPQHFTCCCCGKEFSYNMGIHIEDRVDWRSPDCVPIGVVLL